MKTTIKKLRDYLDRGLMAESEIVGCQVNVGFLTLTVTGYRKTPGDYLPNIWILERNGKRYEFTPYNGLELV